jgi:hypothetical protein
MPPGFCRRAGEEGNSLLKLCKSGFLTLRAHANLALLANECIGVIAILSNVKSRKNTGPAIAFCDSG